MAHKVLIVYFLFVAAVGVAWLGFLTWAVWFVVTALI